MTRAGRIGVAIAFVSILVGAVNASELSERLTAIGARSIPGYDDFRVPFRYDAGPESPSVRLTLRGADGAIVSNGEASAEPFSGSALPWRPASKAFVRQKSISTPCPTSASS